MQIAQVVHAIVAILFVALILGHIYIGTLGMEGAFEAMGTGEVDLNWAKEHHDLVARRRARERPICRSPGASLGDAGRMSSAMTGHRTRSRIDLMDLDHRPSFPGCNSPSRSFSTSSSRPSPSGCRPSSRRSASLWMRTGKEHYRGSARFWTKIFAVSFAMGVVSGIVLSYQFGTNWSRFSAVLGNVIGPLIGYEVLTSPSFSKRHSSASCCSAGTACRPGCTRSRPSLVAVGTLALGILDPVRQQLDADAGRIRDARRHRLSARLARQSSSIRVSLTASRTW